MQPNNESNPNNSIDPNQTPISQGSQGDSTIPTNNEPQLHVHVPEVITPTVGESVLSQQQTSPQPETNSSPLTSNNFNPAQQENQTAPAPIQTQPLAPTIQQPVFSESSTPQSTTPPTGDLFGKKAKKKKIFIASMSASLFVIMLLTSYVFAVYIPNKPENVWKTGLERTGKEASAIVEKITDPEAFDSLSKNKMNLNGEVKYAEGLYKIDINSAFDQKETDSTLKFNSDSEQENSISVELDAELKTQIVENSVWPNVYFKLSGFSTLGLSGFVPGIDDYENKWISVEQDFYKDTLDEVLSGSSTNKEESNITQQDLVSVLDDIVAVSQDYLFTADPERAVLKLEEFIGTEESEGITANHYVASINETNASAYCNALVDRVFENEAYKKIVDMDESKLQTSKDNAKKDCEPPEKDEDDTSDEIDTFDIWMDKKQKIFHKVRFSEDLEKQAEKIRQQKTDCLERYASYDTGSSNNNFCDYYEERIETGEKYVEIGQVYDGNDQMMLFVNQKNETNRQKDYLRTDITIDINNLTYNGKLTYANESEDNPISATFTLTTEPFEGDIDADKPEGSVSLQSVIDDLNSRRQNGVPLGTNTDEDFATPDEEPTRGPNNIDQLLDLLSNFR